MGYIACGETKESPRGKLYTPSHVGLNWQLSLGADVLIGFEVEIKISALNFIAPVLGDSEGVHLARELLAKAPAAERPGSYSDCLAKHLRAGGGGSPGDGEWLSGRST